MTRAAGACRDEREMWPMPTSESERREVAERMRVVADGPYVDPLSFGEMMNSVLTDGAPRPTNYREMFRCLADLIDPTCHLGPAHFGGFGCDRCFTWFPDMKKRTSHCPECGARVVDDE